MAPAQSALARHAPLATPLSRSGRVVSAVAPLRLGAVKRVVRSRATETDSEPKSNTKSTKVDVEIKEKFDDILENVQKTWKDTDEKPAVIAIGVAAFVGIWAINGVASSLDSLPFVGGLLELVGILVTGWFTYRYLVFGPDRDELKVSIDDFLKKITGN